MNDIDILYDDKDKIGTKLPDAEFCVGKTFGHAGDDIEQSTGC
jgi:hypothetical protein